MKRQIFCSILLAGCLAQAYTNTTLNISACGGTLSGNGYTSIGSLVPVGGQTSQSGALCNYSGFAAGFNLQPPLRIAGGTSSGSYTNGATMTIAADAPAIGKAFDRWIGDTQYVADAMASTTTVTLPVQAISLTATYKDVYYALTVNRGTGDGSFTNRTQVAISADAPAIGKAFDRWIGDTQYVNNVTYTNALVTMPAAAVSLTATYVDVYYALTVNRGTGDGSFTNATQVAIAADAPVLGKAFDRWVGDAQYVASATSSHTLVTMPAQNASLTATYKDVYELTVNSGSGQGWYTNGARVVIAADVRAGQVFVQWSGAIPYVASVTSSPTTVTMPAQNISVAAAYVADITRPTVTITAPTAGLKILATNGPFTVRGTASDNKIVTNVLVQLNGGSWTNAGTTNGWKTWSLPVILVPGTNTIRAYSVDSAVNNSLTASVACTYAVTGSLTIQTNGLGTITRSPTGVPEVGKTYTLTAMPGAGYSFSSWTGDLRSTNRALIFTMSSSKTLTANFTDIQKPTVAITAPTARLKILATNGLFTVKGTAADNLMLSNVLVQLNGGSWTNAGTTNGWKTWSLAMTLMPGTNIIRAFSVDTTSNYSLPSSVTCVYVPTAVLTTRTNGPGAVTRSPTGVPEVGKTYTLTATPKTGSVFSNWTGDAVSNPTSKVVTITMTSNKTVTANFIDIQKPTVKITYPTALMRVMTNGTVVLRGTATDNGILQRVTHQLYTGEWTNAVSTNGWKNWTASFYPVSGLNTTRVYSVDMRGNISATSTVVFTYVPGAVMQVQTNGAGTITPAYNGKVLEIGKSYTMTAAAKAGVSVFTSWTDGIGGQVTNKAAITFVMRTNLVLTANFRSLLPTPALAEVAADMPATSQAAITVDGSIKDWANVPCASFSYASVTQEVAVALDENSIALRLNGCPFDASDNVLVYFKLRLNYGVGDDRHSVDLWTSGSVLCGTVDGQAITGLEAVLLNGVLEVKLPVEQAPSQVTIEEIGCGMDLGDGTLTELFRLTPP